jgi:hypothetical protein
VSAYAKLEKCILKFLFKVKNENTEVGGGARVGVGEVKLGLARQNLTARLLYESIGRQLCLPHPSYTICLLKQYKTATIQHQIATYIEDSRRKLSIGSFFL